MLAAALLLLMQALVLEHQLDLEQHADGDSCELCLHLPSLDQGLLSSPDLLPLPAPASTLITAEIVQAPARHAIIYHSRAPPRHS